MNNFEMLKKKAYCIGCWIVVVGSLYKLQKILDDELSEAYDLLSLEQEIDSRGARYRFFTWFKDYTTWRSNRKDFDCLKLENREKFNDFIKYEGDSSDAVDFHAMLGLEKLYDR